MAKYTVKQGDTIMSIAKTNNTFPDVLLNANPNFTALKPGMVLNLPVIKLKNTSLSQANKIPPNPFKGTAPSPTTIANKTSNANVGQAPVPAALKNVPATSFGAGTGSQFSYNAGILGYGKEYTLRDLNYIVQKINIGNRPYSVSDEVVKLLDQMNPTPSGTSKAGLIYMTKNGYVKNPISGNWVLRGTPTSGYNAYTPPATPLAPTSSANEYKGPYGGYETFIRSGYSTGTSGQEGFVPIRSGSNAFGSSGGGWSYAGKEAQSSWKNKKSKKKTTTTTTGGGTTNTNPQTYNSNYVSYGVGLIHWRV